jgi:hypothetical protein
MRRAYAMDESDPDALVWLTILSYSSGQTSLARCLADRLESIDPEQPLAPLFVAYGAFFAGEPESERASLARAMEIGGDVPPGLWAGVRIYLALGEESKAEEVVHALEESHPDSNFLPLAKGFLEAYRGIKDPARNRLSPELLAWTKNVAEWAQFIADYFALLGEETLALEWLELSRSSGFLNSEFIDDFDPFLASIRQRSDFATLVDRIRQDRERFEADLAPLDCMG